MSGRTLAALVIQRSEWFGQTADPDAMNDLEEDSDRILIKLSPFLDVAHIWSVSSSETAIAAGIGLAAADEIELVILALQTRVDRDYLDILLKGIGNRPLVVWGYIPWRRIPQPVAYEALVKGGSFSGATVTLARLHDLGIPHLATFGSADDPQVLKDVERFACAAHVAHGLRRLQLGLLCDNPAPQPPPMNCALQALGLTVRVVSSQRLADLISLITSQAIDQAEAALREAPVEVMITDDTLRLGLRNVLALHQLAATEGLDYLALPEHNAAFRQQYGLCPGLPASLMNPEATCCIPTLDLPALAAHVLLQQASQSVALLMRIWFWDRAKNTILGGHGGPQDPTGIAHGTIILCGDYECAREDPDGGAQLEFVARPGRVTLLQLHQTAQGCRATACSGYCLESDPRVEGVPHALVRLDCSIDAFLREMAHGGASAYWSMVYGNHLDELEALFAFKAIAFSVLND
jgi:L-fucose isomerase-like protein